MTDNEHSGVGWWWTAVVVALAAAQVWLHAGFVADDAYITFRYSRNLAEGLGWVFNAGEGPAEGTTSYLWTVIGVPAFALGWDVLLWARVLSAGAWVGVLVVTSWMAGRVGGRGAAVLAPLVLASVSWGALHVLSGMETMLFTLLVAVTVALAMRMMDEDAPRGRLAWVMGPAILLMALTRPEGNLIGLAAVAMVVWLRGGSRVMIGPLLATWVVPGAVFFAARWWYFGHALPLPFYVKVGDAGLFAGATNVMRFTVWVALTLGAGLAMLGREWARREVRLLAAVPVALMVFYTIPEPVMGFGQRFLFPVLPLLVALAATGVATAVDKRALGTVGAVLFLWMVLVVGVHTTKSSAGWAARYSTGLKAAHAELARDLVAMQTPGRAPADHRLAIGDVGLVPFATGWTTRDLVGLNDPRVAHRKPRQADEVLRPRPDAIVLLSRDAEDFESLVAFEGEVFEEIARLGEYERLRTYAFSPRYHLWLYLRSESED